MTKWNRILLRKEYAKEEPAEIVVDFASILKKVGARRILDVGCGAGRHLVYLARRGFEPYGVDIALTGLRMAKGRLKKHGLMAEMVKADMKAMPYADGCFDAALSIATVYHQRKAQIQETISEIYRVLKRGGLFLADFHSKRSGRYGKGIKVEEDTFMDVDGPEKGVLHHFLDEQGLLRMLKNFEIISLKTDEKLTNNYLRSRIYVIAKKL